VKLNHNSKIPVRARAFYVPGNAQTGCAAQKTCRLINTGGNFLAGAELANHHALVSRLRMSGAVLPIPQVFAAGTGKKINRKSYPIITIHLKNYCTDVHYIWYNNDISYLLHLRPVPIGTVSDSYRIRLRIKT
jgi:hypothetical protein